MKNIHVTFLDCNYNHGGILVIKCDTFEQIDSNTIKVNDAEIFLTNNIESIDIREV